MVIVCELCGRQLGGIVCVKCGNVSSTPYSCSHCGQTFARTLCSECGEDLSSRYGRSRGPSEANVILRKIAIILPITLILFFILLIVLGGI